LSGEHGGVHSGAFRVGLPDQAATHDSPAADPDAPFGNTAGNQS
jgi:hypothetical protein